MCSFTFIIWKRAAWTFCSMIKSNAVQNKMMVSKLWLNLHSPLTIMILLSHNIYHLRAQTRSHEKWHSNLCSQSTGWRNWSSLEVRRLCHFYRTQSSHQRPTANRRAENSQRSKSARLHSGTSVCKFSCQHSNPSRSYKPTWGNLRECECQSVTEGSVKSGNMLTDLHGTLPQPDHFKKHDIFHAVFLVVTVHASSSFPRSFPLLSRALLTFLRLKQSDITGQQ